MIHLEPRPKKDEVFCLYASFVAFALDKQLDTLDEIM